MLYGEEVIERMASPGAYARGQKLYWASAVKRAHASVSALGLLTISGRVVEGGRPYRVKLAFNQGRHALASVQCNCGQSEFCEHGVALGLAGMFAEISKEATVEASADSFVSTSAITKKLATLGVTKGASGLRSKRVRLDRITLDIAYDVGSDAVTIIAKVIYGSQSFPLLTPSIPTEWTEGGKAFTLERDIITERHAWTELRYRAGLEEAETGTFLAQQETLYWFIKETLPSLEASYEVHLDGSMKPLLAIERAEIASSWDAFSESKGSWFDFSVAWHCANSSISTHELEDMVKSGRPYIRTKDGAFIECANREDVEEMLSELKRAEKQEDGTFRAPLYLAPELMQHVARSRAHRLEETNQAFNAFLEETKRGALLEHVPVARNLASQLREYQIQGVEWMFFLRRYGFGGVLADDMGLGKTVQVLALLSTLKDRGELTSPALVVCPKTLVLNWVNEIEKFTPELRIVTLDGGVSERASKRADISTADIVITSYSMLTRDAEYYATTRPFSYVVFDEAQYVKNDRTLTARSAKLIPAERRLALTGTPLENGVHELWSIFDVLMPGFLGDERAFRSKYVKPIHEQDDARALESLRMKVRPFMLRRTKEAHLKDLPPKIEQVSSCALAPEQVLTYARVLEDVRTDVFRAVQQKGFDRSRIEILSALTKLRRVCDHPALVDSRLPRTSAVSGKLQQAMELVREARAGGHKVLFFSQFTTMLDIVREALEEEGIGHCTIEGKTRNRGAEVKKFESDPDTGIFLLSLKAGGTGLTLNSADTVILYDPWWNPLAERQAMDRAHRIGQTKTVNVYKLVTKETVEEKVLELQKKKQRVFDAIMDGVVGEMDALTWEDVQGLLGAP